jgi:hypothetical protein
MTLNERLELARRASSVRHGFNCLISRKGAMHIVWACRHRSVRELVWHRCMLELGE